MKSSALWLLVLSASLAGGCKKADSETQVAKAQENQTTAGQASAADRGPGPMPMNQRPVVVREGDTGAALNQLSLELRKYVLRTRTAPKNFDEFIALSKVQAPPPPPGKKYAIQSGKVVLVKS